MLLPRWLLNRQEAASSAVVVVTQSKPVFTWGLNSFGELGLGDTITRSSPVQIGTSSWIMVAAGASTTVGIRSDSTLFTWGAAAGGALGNGTTIGNRSSPIAIGTSSWTYVTGGNQNFFAIRTDGGLFAWGINSTGKLGLGDATLRNSPVQVGASSWTMVSSYNLTSGGVTTNRALFMWGLGGTLGTGVSLATNRSSPVQVTVGAPNSQSLFTQVAVGESGAIAIDADGLGYFWGLAGQVNLSYNIPWKNKIEQSILAPIPLSTFNNETEESNYITATGKTALSWVQAVGGVHGGMALRSDKKIYIWGSNQDGSLGINSTSVSEVRFAPQLIVSQSTFNYIASGGYEQRQRYFALDTNGILYSWGNNNNGALGVGDTVRRVIPTAVNITSSFVFVAAGPVSTAAIATDGSLFTWGEQTNGQLGNGATAAANVLNPSKIGTSSWYRVSIGYRFMNGITGTYKLFSWGLGTSGVIGDGTANTRSVPTAIGTSSWIFVSSGNSSAFAIRSDSTLWAWGNNHVGQLGLGDTIARSSPVQIASPANWKYVDAANNYIGGPSFSPYYRTYGIASDNTLYAWGFFNAGTGLSAALNGRSSPVQISLSQYSNVDAGLCFTVAVRTNGVQYYWGATDSFAKSPIYNSGDGAAIAYSTLQFVQSNYESFRLVTSGLSNGAAIRSDYKLFTWGRDDQGQLGIGAGGTVTRSNPVQVGSSSWTQVALGDRTMYAIDTNGRLFSWGDSSGGFRGSGNLVNSSSPIQIGSSSWTMVNAYKSTVVALRV